MSVRQSSDVVSINFDVSRNISETLALSDSASTNKTALQNISESLIFTDSVDVHRTIYLDETLVFTDSYDSINSLSVQITESLSMNLVSREEIDTDGNSANGVTSISLGGTGIDIEFDPVNGRMYVAIQSREWIEVIDTNTYSLIDANGASAGSYISVGDIPQMIAYDSANERMYVTNEGDDTVSVIDTTDYSVDATISVGEGPRGIAYDPVKIGRAHV